MDRRDFLKTMGGAGVGAALTRGTAFQQPEAMLVQSSEPIMPIEQGMAIGTVDPLSERDLTYLVRYLEAMYAS